MENLIGRFALLPNGNKVVIVEVNGEFALVRRLGGYQRGMRAVCSLERLKILS
jgi:hypothetical protein